MPRSPLKLFACRKTPARSLLCAALGFAFLPEPAAAELALERVVLVSRHGVRAPTNSAALADYTKSRTWPTWLVAHDADLTPRGEELASLMGAFYRQHFGARGVLPREGCPAANQAFVYADVDQRTRLTGNGLLAGAFPGCGLFAQYRTPMDKPDPLFHPTKAGVCKIDTKVAREAIEKRAPAPLEEILKTPPYSDSVKKLQSVLDCCKPKVCHDRLPCTLEGVPSKIVENEKDDSVSLSGPISIGSTTSEVFLLQYGQGMPEVAWERAPTAGRLMPLLRLHGLQFDLMQRTDYLARRQGSALLQQVLETLRQTAEEGSSDAPLPVPREAKLVIYVGHDTNLANIGGILDAHWSLPSYLPDETPPAGAMAFELLRETSSGRYFVRLAYYSQTLDQMRNVAPLGDAQARNNKAAPDMARIAIGQYCRGRAKDGACPWSDFYAQVGFGTKTKPNPKPTLDPDCVIAKPL